jgi:SET domain
MTLCTVVMWDFYPLFFSSKFYLINAGAAAYGTLSLINHSCDPNVVRNYYSSHAVVRAIRLALMSFLTMFPIRRIQKEKNQEKGMVETGKQKEEGYIGIA